MLERGEREVGPACSSATGTTAIERKHKIGWCRWHQMSISFGRYWDV